MTEFIKDYLDYQYSIKTAMGEQINLADPVKSGPEPEPPVPPTPTIEIAAS